VLVFPRQRLELAMRQREHRTVPLLHEPRMDRMLVGFQKDEADRCRPPIVICRQARLRDDDAGLMHGRALVGPKCRHLRSGRLVLVIKW
jgi:hypothetical protein